MTTIKKSALALLSTAAFFLPLAAYGSTLATLHSFASGVDGKTPLAAMLNVGGVLYGTTNAGGPSGAGTVFKITTAGAEVQLYAFTGGADGKNPDNSLINVGGVLFGTTVGGGTSNLGTVFKITTAGVKTTLHSFTGGAADGSAPSAAMLNIGGILYGTTANGGSSNMGTVFSIDSTSGIEGTIHSFAGGVHGKTPLAALVNISGYLYGTTQVGGTSNLGTVFKVNHTTGVETTLHSFTAGSDGQNPQAALLNVGGILYGTTSTGGTSGAGTVFKITTAGVETPLYSFTGGADGGYPAANLIYIGNVSGAGGFLYGTTYSGGTSSNGAVFKIDPATSIETPLYSFTGGNDGQYINAALINVGGTLYGAADYGGTAASGTVFKIDPGTGTETTLYSFASGVDGQVPYAGLLNVGGTLYGTTTNGGTSGLGTVFKINRTTGAEVPIHSFTGGSDGQHPFPGLVDISGVLYGTTDSGGFGGGTLFSVTTAGALTTLHSFSGGASDGQTPSAGLINVGGVLYGTTQGGGAYSFGTVFKSTTAGAVQVLHSFGSANDGRTPYAGLINAGSYLYGTTAFGGAASMGTVFKINRTTGVEAPIPLHSFTGGADGANPYTALINVGGALYGTTGTGGTPDLGTVFKITTAGVETPLYAFAGGSDGAYPFGTLIEVFSSVGSPGVLYGTTNGGGTSGVGTLYKITLAGTETPLHTFTGPDGGNPRSALILDTAGFLYGTTAYGGTAGNGTVFKFTP